MVVDPEGFDIGYSYYKDGQRRTMVDPDSGRFTYSYDSIGRLETILNPYGETTTLVYDIADRRIGQLLANGVITSLSYDDANRLDEVISRNSSSVLLSSFNYLLDPAGNRTTLTASGSDGFLWSYDKTNQLLTERRTLSADTYAHTYTYDPRGNRLTLSDTDMPPVSYVYDYDDANRLKTVTDVNGVTTYTFDASGNQLTIEEPSGDITTNSWNGENRLVQVEHPDSTITEYRYNGDGLKVFEDHDGTVTLFVYDGNNRLQETDDTGLVEAEFTYVPLPYAEVLSQHRALESSFYLCDGIRNIRQLTDDTQTITDEYSFDAFGNLRSSTGSSANSQLYKGHLLSYRNDPHAGPDTETSTHFRNQSAQTGRFTSEDPAADDHNLYRLVGNNPVNKEDPSGLDFVTTDGNLAIWVVEGSYGRNGDRIDLGVVEGDTIFLRDSLGGGQVSLASLQRFVSAGLKHHQLQFGLSSLFGLDWTERRGWITFAASEVNYRDRNPKLIAGSIPAASNPSRSIAENAKEFGPMVGELAWYVGSELALEFGTGAAITAIARGGKLILRGGGKTIEYTAEQLAKRIGRKADEIPLDDLAKRLDGHAADEFTELAKWKPPARGSLLHSNWNNWYRELRRAFPTERLKYVDSDPPIINGRPSRGSYNSVTDIITLYRSADEMTLFHELLHRHDFDEMMRKFNWSRQDLARIMRDPQVLNAAKHQAELRIARIMLDLGFIPNP